MADRENPTDLGSPKEAQGARLDASRRLSMEERLARVHSLSKQMSLIKGAAKSR